MQRKRALEAFGEASHALAIFTHIRIGGNKAGSGEADNLAHYTVRDLSWSNFRGDPEWLFFFTPWVESCPKSMDSTRRHPRSGSAMKVWLKTTPSMVMEQSASQD